MGDRSTAAERGISRKKRLLATNCGRSWGEPCKTAGTKRFFQGAGPGAQKPVAVAMVKWTEASFARGVAMEVPQRKHGMEAMVAAQSRRVYIFMSSSGKHDDDDDDDATGRQTRGYSEHTHPSKRRSRWKMEQTY